MRKRWRSELGPFRDYLRDCIEEALSYSPGLKNYLSGFKTDRCKVVFRGIRKDPPQEFVELFEKLLGVEVTVSAYYRKPRTTKLRLHLVPRQDEERQKPWTILSYLS